MKLYELLNEVFRPGRPPEPARALSDRYTARKHIGGREIICTALKNEGTDTWEFDFAEKTTRGQTYSITRSGSPIKVFGFVVDCVRDIIYRYKPSRIEFAASTLEGNRADLYQKIAERSNIIPGYHFAGRRTEGAQAIITIERDDLDEAADLRKRLGAGVLGTALALGGGALNNYEFEPGQHQITEPESKLGPNFEILKRAVKQAGFEPNDILHILSQSAHETGNFSAMTEPSGAKYDPENNPRKARILGNTEPGDGDRYRGRGYFQLTGRHNYEWVTKALADPNIDLVKNPELAADPKIAADIAIWWYENRVKPFVGDNPDVRSVTKRINPGLAGLAERERYYEKFKQELGRELGF